MKKIFFQWWRGPTGYPFMTLHTRRVRALRFRDHACARSDWKSLPTAEVLEQSVPNKVFKKIEARLNGRDGVRASLGDFEPIKARRHVCTQTWQAPRGHIFKTVHPHQGAAVRFRHTRRDHGWKSHIDGTIKHVEVSEEVYQAVLNRLNGRDGVRAYLSDFGYKYKS